MDIRSFIKSIIEENFLAEYDFESFIRRYNIGPGLSIKVKNDPSVYYIKNIAPNRKSVFVTDAYGNGSFNKYLGNIVSIGGKPVTLTEYVRKRGNEYVVLSKKGKVLGKGYHSKKAANKRLGQIEYFKSLGEADVQAGFDVLEKKLLSLGGTRVVENYEPDLHRLLTRGQVFDGKKDRIVKMKASRCHSNSSCIWHKYSDKMGYDAVKIVTGWALTNDDGYWRQHTWVYLPKEDTIIETTVKRDKYFGYILTDDEADKFWWHNYIRDDEN